MAEDQDREGRTEEPTEKRLQDAIDKGNVPFSREAVTFGSLVSILLVSLLMAGPAVVRLGEALLILFSNAGSIRFEAREDANALLLAAATRIALVVLPLMAVIAAGGLIASLFQNLPQANAERIRPQWNRLSPGSGLRRLFGFAGLSEFAKSVAKLLAVALVAAVLVKAELPRILNVLTSDPAAMADTVRSLCNRVLAALVVVALLLAGVDLWLSRFKWRRQLRMTRQEIKDEFKQAEGDPHIKGRIRSIARQRLSRRMIKKVPSATVVITNPTHYAVALRYVREEGGAPVVVAKGLDHLALRIRAIAAEHTIPIVENKPLARALYDQADLDQMIPPEFYKAVAEIIHFLQLRKAHGAAGRV
jgi:flagellar biosynthetic protein FlhB